MKSLEKYIIKNRDKFDREEPEPGHLERFLDKQQGYSKKPRIYSWKYLLRAAAVTILAVLSSLWAYEKFSGATAEIYPATLADISHEYKEAEIYYTAMISRKYNEIKSFDFPDNSIEKDILLRELSEMDKVYKSLEKDLNTERGNHMVISAMIRHYQLKLTIMSRILEHLHQIESAEKLKTTEDEDIRI